MPDIVTSKIFVDGEKGITATKLNQIISGAVIQPDFYTNKASSSTLDPTDTLLELKGSGSYAQIAGSQLISSVSSSVGANMAPLIWSTRLRSFNAIGNPTFEVDQRNVGNTIAAPSGGIIDRWGFGKAGSMVMSAGQQPAAAGDILVPGTNFAISRKFFRLTLTTAQASLAATDYGEIFAAVEGPQFRELQYDVHSLQVLVRSSVAGLKFGLSIQDSPATRSLTKLATIPTANTWTLLTFPNLPVFPTGNFNSAPGAIGYLLIICLGAGTTYTAPANDTWQNGNFLGALGQDNFASKAVNSTFDVAFVQHEPGSQCTTPIDKPFTQNYDECLRYYFKSVDYDVAVNTATGLGYIVLIPRSTGDAFGTVKFPKPMAKIPTVTLYNGSTGAINSVRMVGGGDYVVTSVSGIGKTGFGGALITSLPAPAAGATLIAQYTADTGW